MAKNPNEPLDLKGLSQDLRQADSFAAKFSYNMEHLVSSLMGVKSATHLLHDSMRHHLQDNNSAKSDLDELRMRAGDYADQLKRVNEQLATMDVSGIKSDIHLEQKQALITEIGKVNEEFSKLGEKTKKAARFDLTEMIMQITSAKRFMLSSSAGVIAVKYIQLSGEFNRTLAAANQQLDERNRLLNQALGLQISTGLTTKETAEMFEGLRQRGVLYMDSNTRSLAAFSKASAGVSSDFGQIVKSANMLAVATGASRQEAVELFATSQQLNVSYASLAELANKLAKQTTLTGSGAIKLVEQIGELRAQYNVKGVGLENVAADIAAVQDALTSVGSKDSQMAVKFAGAISDLTTSTGQFATMLGAGGEAVLADSGRFVAATENLARFAGQYKNNTYQFKSIADSLGLSRLELQQIVRVFEEGKLGASRAKLKDTISLTDDYEAQLANTARVWRRLLDSAIALAVKGIAPLTWGVDKLQRMVAGFLAWLEKAPDLVVRLTEAVVGLGSIAATIAAVRGLSAMLAAAVPGLSALKAGLGNWPIVAWLTKQRSMGSMSGTMVKAAATAAAPAAAGKAASMAATAAAVAELFDMLGETTSVLGKIGADISAAVKSSMPGVALSATLSGWFRAGLEGFKAAVSGLFSKITSFVSGIFTRVAGFFSSVILRVATPLAIIASILIWWKQREAAKNLRDIEGVYSRKDQANAVIDKALRTFQAAARSGAPASKLIEIAEIQRKAALGLVRKQDDIFRERNSRGLLDSMADFVSGVSADREQYTITDVSTEMARRLAAGQSASAYESGAVIGSQISMEAPRATITRLDTMVSKQQEFVAAAKMLHETSVESKAVLVSISKLIEQQNRQEQQRADDERKARVLSAKPENPFGPLRRQ